MPYFMAQWHAHSSANNGLGFSLCRQARTWVKVEQNYFCARPIFPRVWSQMACAKSKWNAIRPYPVHIHSIWFHPSLISFLPLVLISYSLASSLRSDASKIKFTKALAASAKSSPDIISILGCGQLPDLGMKTKCRASLCSWIMSGMWEVGWLMPREILRLPIGTHSFWKGNLYDR